VRQRPANGALDAGTVVRRIAEAVGTGADGVVRTHSGQAEIFVLHQLQARLRQIAGVCLRPIGGDAEIGILEVRQRRLERHLVIMAHIGGGLEGAAGADQMELDVGEARRRVLEKRAVEQHRTDSDGVRASRIGARPDVGEIAAMDAERHGIGPVRRPSEIRRHLVGQQAIGVDVAGVPAQLGVERWRRADGVERVGAAVDDAGMAVELPRPVDEHDAEAGFDDDIGCRAQGVVNEPVRQMRIGREQRARRGVQRVDTTAERMKRCPPQIALHAVYIFGAIGAGPQEGAMVAFDERDRAEAHGDEADFVMQPHQRIGHRLDAAAARGPVIVDARHDDDLRLAAVRHGSREASRF